MMSILLNAHHDPTAFPCVENPFSIERKEIIYSRI